MKKVIEFNPKYNLGDIVYGIFNNEVVKAKITEISYGKRSTLVNDDYFTSITYIADSLISSTTYIINEFDKGNGVWFKSKDDIIDYLKTQIDRVTTDDYTINYEAH